MRIDVGDPMFYILTSFNSLVSKSLFCKIIIGECFVCSSSCLWSQLVLAKNNINTFGHRKTTFENGEKEFWLSFVSRYYTHRKQRRCSIKKLFLKMLQSSQQNTCVRVFFSIKLHAIPATLLKRRLMVQVFPINLAKFLSTPLTEHLRRLLLSLQNLFGVFFIVFSFHIYCKMTTS